MYKACIFDLDGTLTDTLESLTYSVNETLKELGLSGITSEKCKAFVGNGARCLIERALNVSGIEDTLMIERAMEIYGRIFGENCTYHVKPYEGITEMLQELKDKGIQLAVLSNKPHDQTVDVVKSMFGDTVFVSVQGQCDELAKKPDPAGVYKLLQMMRVLPQECLYVGDSEVDVATGEAAGLVTVGVNWGFRSRELLEAAGAKHTIDRPDELLQFI